MYPEHDSNDDTKRLFDSIINPVAMKPRMKGRFKLRAMKGDIIVRETAWCPNLIVDRFFDIACAVTGGTTYGISGFIAGSGNATPQETDTALQSYLGGGANYLSHSHTINTSVAPYSKTLKVVFRGSEGAIVGNVAEIALRTTEGGTSPDNNSLMNRALVVDEFGNPTSITVLSDEFLEIEWEITYYAISGATGTLIINMPGGPQSFDYEIQPVSMGNTSQWWINWQYLNSAVRFGMRAIPYAATSANEGRCHVTAESSFSSISSGAAPTGYASGNAFTSITSAPYTMGSKTRLSTIRLPLGNGNIAAPGIRSINIGLLSATSGPAWCTHQVLLDGPFQKLNTQVFDLPINVSMGNT